MKKFFLRGLAEGLTGCSSVMAINLRDVFNQFPILQQVKEKLIVKNNTINGFSACDG